MFSIFHHTLVIIQDLFYSLFPQAVSDQSMIPQLFNLTHVSAGKYSFE